MNYDKGSITAFLDQAAPFNDSYSKSLLSNPIIRKMAEDIEGLYLVRDENLKVIKTLGKVISRQRKFMVVGGVLCFAAGSIQYYKDKQAKTEKNGL